MSIDLEALNPVPDGWQVESGEGGFDGTRWVCVRNLRSQLGQDFYEDRDPFMFAFVSEFVKTEGKR